MVGRLAPAATPGPASDGGQPDLAREPDLGRATHPRRVDEARVLPARVNGRALHSNRLQTTWAIPAISEEAYPSQTTPSGTA